MDKLASIIKDSKGDPRIKIEFPYDLDTLTNVRTLAGRTYHVNGTFWSTPYYQETIDLLNEWDFPFDMSLIEFMYYRNQVAKKFDDEDIPGLKKTLRPFQKKGVSFIDANNGRALVADEMGLGKTVQSLAWIQLHRDKIPVIIVVPASVKINWKREIEAWLPDTSIEILHGYKTHKPTADFIIVNYEILHMWWKVLRELNPQVIITDECHYYKNEEAKRTKAVRMLAKGVPHFIALSGTPIENRPIEIFNAVDIINPDIFNRRWDFLNRYCGAKYNGFGWDFSGASNVQELHRKLVGTIMIRRLKVDVLPELPQKVRSFIPMELTNRKLYNAAEADFIRFVRITKGDIIADRALRAEALVYVETMRQLAAQGKLEMAIQWIRDTLEVENKIIIFTTHTDILNQLMEEFKGIAVKLDGSNHTDAQRQAPVDAFQNDPEIKLFVGNIKAAGKAITLTASSTVAFLELPWTPGSLDQAEDRAHRIGQTEKVNIYHLLAEDTIEEKFARLLDKKKKTIDAVMDGRETDDSSLLEGIISEYKNPTLF
jgi:SWI/SNF-related matrix-associated actin-dependent regulator of chromatin subfamily A-like protein 1